MCSRNAIKSFRFIFQIFSLSYRVSMSISRQLCFCPVLHQKAEKRVLSAICIPEVTGLIQIVFKKIYRHGRYLPGGSSRTLGGFN